MKILDIVRHGQRHPGWIVLPLRLYLGVTFAYAGLHKLLDPSYLDRTAPGGVEQQMLAVVDSSPVGALVGFGAEHATVAGTAIALTEIAVGSTVLLGLFTRAAATGGLLLALSFFLTVSWSVRPYFLGADISLVFAWTPLVIAGDGGVLSLGARLRARVRRRHASASEQDVDRRTVALRGAVAAVLVAAGVSAGSAVALGRRGSGTGSGPSRAPGTRIAAVVDVPVGTSVKFTTAAGAPAYLLRPAPDTFLAYLATCTHQGCEVLAEREGFRCPCHGGTYDLEGRVTGGPPPAPLGRIAVRVVNGFVTTA